MTRAAKVAKHRGGSKPRRAAVAGAEQINVRVTGPEKAALEQLADGADVTVSALLRDGGLAYAGILRSAKAATMDPLEWLADARDAMAAANDVAGWLLDTTRERALTAIEDAALRRLCPEGWELESRDGPLTSDPAIRKAG